MYLNTAGLKRDSCHESYEEGVLNLRVICYLTQSVVKLSLWVSASLQLNLFLKSKISLKSVIVLASYSSCSLCRNYLFQYATCVAWKV